jgi:hypothetical protein
VRLHSRVGDCARVVVLVEVFDALFCELSGLGHCCVVQ